MKEITFIGGTGNKQAFGGELTKNKFLITFLKNKGFNVHVVDTYRARKKPWNVIKIFVLLLFRRKDKVIFSTSYGNIEWLIKILWKLKDKRDFYYFGIGGGFPGRLIKGEFDKDAFHLFKYIIVEGTKMKEELLSIGFDNAVVVPNFKKVSYLPTLQNRQNNKVRFVFMSRIHPQKGCNYIIECAERLNKEGYKDKYCVDFYGPIEDFYKEEFLRKIQPLDNVVYKGSLNLQENKGFDTLASYNAMLFPTYWCGEGFPGVVIDAYIAGLPLIASDWSLNKEWIKDGQTGYIVKTHDTEELYNTMLRVVNNPNCLDTMYACCQKEAVKFDVDKVLTEELMQRIELKK